MNGWLILDCDGVLADTERHGHLPAFNRAFAELGLPIRWTDEEYGKLTRIGGGKERMRHALSTMDNAPEGADLDNLVAALHQRKSRLFREMVLGGHIPPRPGVRRLVRAALEDGWTLGVASTSAEDSVRAVLERAVGAELAARFGTVVAGDAVSRKKPAPDVYLEAGARLGAVPESTVAIEDSAVGHRSARAAGLATLITVSDYTRQDAFPGASLVVDCLGEPDGPPAIVTHSAIGSLDGDLVTVATLRACLGRGRP